MNAYAPDVDALEKLLDERAKHLAASAEDKRVRELAYQIAEVQVGEMRLGIDATCIREITPLSAVTRFPGQPASLRGLTQVRGELMSLVDSASIMNVADAPEPQFCVVIESEHGSIALAVQAVNGFRGVYSDELIDGFAVDARPLRALTGDFLGILDVPRLLESDAVRVQ